MDLRNRSKRDPRDAEALRRHYDIECELADRLRYAPREERAHLYRTVYNELFTRVPDHPQNTRKQDPERYRAARVSQMRLLQKFLTPEVVYLEIGAGDCNLALDVASRVKKVYAVDVSDVIAEGSDRPSNFELIISSDGIHFGLPGNIVDVAYSYQLIEHLHPDDAMAQIEEVYRVLAPGGIYICITPHRFAGPHEISQMFATEARGLHLKEYTYQELGALFQKVGFAQVSGQIGLKGRFWECHQVILRGVEKLLKQVPSSHAWRRRIARSLPMRVMCNSIIMVGRKG